MTLGTKNGITLEFSALGELTKIHWAEFVTDPYKNFRSVCGLLQFGVNTFSCSAPGYNIFHIRQNIPFTKTVYSYQGLLVSAVANIHSVSLVIDYYPTGAIRSVAQESVASPMYMNHGFVHLHARDYSIYTSGKVQFTEDGTYLEGGHVVYSMKPITCNQAGYGSICLQVGGQSLAVTAADGIFGTPDGTWSCGRPGPYIATPQNVTFYPNGSPKNATLWGVQRVEFKKPDGSMIFATTGDSLTFDEQGSVTGVIENVCFQ